MYGAGDVRVEDRPEPQIQAPTDAIIRLSASCICGSDLWPYRGADPINEPSPMGHEYAGIVEEVGSAVSTIKPGQFVVGSFVASDNTCEICRAGYQTSCVHGESPGPAQAQSMRVPLADGTLASADVPTTGVPLPRRIRRAGDWLVRRRRRRSRARKTVAVVGDGTSACSGSPARQLGAGLDNRDGRHPGSDRASSAPRTSSKSVAKEASTG
jgi:threonine dehydrogenase-like Zn-dependent dehydrogenase